MNENADNKIIIVLGVGRTGTSLLMNILHNLGMNISEQMTPASEQNVLGGYEDREVFEVQSKILEKLNTKQVFPMPDGWLDNPEINEYQIKLNNIITKNVQSATTIWGVKDPRTAILLPLWVRILNKNNIVPSYLLTTRDPSTVVRSLKNQYNQGEEISELFWLNKNCTALEHTGSNCYILHYEDWFIRPLEVVMELMRYTGIDQYFTGNIDQILKTTVKVNLNRAVHDTYEVQNEHVKKLYDAIKECRGDEFDRERLMAVVRECRKAMNGFKGWYLEAQKHIALRSEGKVISTVSELDKELRYKTVRIAELETDLKNLVTGNNNLLMENKDLWNEVENFRKRNASQMQLSTAKVDQITEKKCNQIAQTVSVSPQAGWGDKWWRETIVLRHSYSFRLGLILINAVTKPGKNTYMMPYYFAQLVWDIISGKGREKLKQALQGKA